MDKLSEKDLSKFETFAWIVYILYSINAILPITFLAIAGVIISYIVQSEMNKKHPKCYLITHFKWQIATFWLLALGYVLGIVIAFLGLAIGFTMTYSNYIVGMILFYIGIIILISAFIWYIYRVIKGIIKLRLKESL